VSGELELTEVCRRYGGSILRRCQAILGDVAEAEDAAQEVFLTFLLKGRSFRGDAQLGTWIYRVTTNLCLNRLRGGRRREAREQTEAVRDWLAAAGTGLEERVEARRRLERLLGDVDELAQQVFILKYLDGLTQEEIAAVTGKSRRTVGKRLALLEQRFRA
jgi:RNA polymerase sigma-70 factor (ECF subfamily)